MLQPTRSRATYAAAAATALLITILFSSPSTAQTAKEQHAPDTLPGVEPEMLTADYWIALQSDPDAVIMTPAEIRRFNEKARTKRVEFTDYFGKEDPLRENYLTSSANGLVMRLLEPLNIGGTVPGDSLRARLQLNVDLLLDPMPLYGSTDFYDNRNAIYDERMKREIIGKMNMEAVPASITPRYGIVVNHALVRQYPTPVPGYSDLRGRLDRFQLTDLCIGNPVAVLHRSTDGDYLFVECPLARGWIRAEDIAIGGHDSIRTLVEDTNFLMATADRVPVYGDPGFEHFARFFYFSATMPLIGNDAKGYRVKMPVRRSDGSFAVETGYIRPDADVHIGYLPYTKRNMLVQIFKLLGTPYGWHGQDNKRDCAGTMRVLLRCFGIKVGKNPSFILSAADHQYRMNPALSAEDKTREAAKLEGVVTLAGNSGHIVMFLGAARNGKLYYIHQAGWGYRDSEGIQRIVGRVTVNCTEHGFYSINSPNVFATFRK